ncbi:MAG: hypothetical protein HFH35_12725 [Eubacterium sp.]|nr:hypothetical protein [Eubacterium sp.]
MWITFGFGKNYLEYFNGKTGFQLKNEQDPALSAKTLKRYTGCFYIADDYPQSQKNSPPGVDKSFF